MITERIVNFEKKSAFCASADEVIFFNVEKKSHHEGPAVRGRSQETIVSGSFLTLARGLAGQDGTAR